MSDTAYVLLWQLGLCASSFILGAIALFAYMLRRMMQDPRLDDSNITNPLRLLSHAVMHPGDFLQAYYLTKVQIALLEQKELSSDNLLQPLGWYLDRDEISQVVKTRPPL